MVDVAEADVSAYVDSVEDLRVRLILAEAPHLQYTHSTKGKKAKKHGSNESIDIMRWEREQPTGRQGTGYVGGGGGEGRRAYSHNNACHIPVTLLYCTARKTILTIGVASQHIKNARSDKSQKTPRFRRPAGKALHFSQGS